ncbi:MAG: ATP-binding protein [Planctomycetales bacterium]
MAYTVGDEGSGCDPSKLPDPANSENVLRAHGRGLLLIRSFMDHVKLNDNGTEITIIKHRKTVNS